ncbi:MAG: F-box protein [Paenibacillus sp.]|uniref:F-box domain-containing protein n=1 Tax=Thamnidium elegans TaxID=101142 RepID=A0A8H7SHW9_9FUNG|nr:hypothetical protein INT48_005878 [Thamnidium elegans]MBM6385826.1 F-box protein [Paenibacillus sp.]
MSHWISLPTEIIIEILRQFETEPISTPYCLSYDEILIPTTDLLQLQLTCKSWSPIAQSIIYQCVVLESVSQLGIFISTLINNGIGVLVENIYINFTGGSPEFLVSPIASIAQHCPNLKTLCSGSYTANKFWEVIERERTHGFLTRLEVMPLLDRNLSNDISVIMYNSAASQLRQRLCELIVCDMDVDLAEDRLLNFPNIKALRFDLTKYANMYTIDQQIKNHLSIEYVSIYYEDNERDIIVDDRNSHTGVLVSSQAKRLYIESDVHTRRFYSYIMEVFPNLENIFLVHSNSCHNQILLPSTEAAQLFHYLMDIPLAGAHFHFSGSQNNFMVQVYDKSNTIQHLLLEYKSVDRMVNDPSYLTINSKDSIEGEMDIEVSFFEGVPLTLPRTGLIEKSGYNLLSLEIDMNLIYDEMNLVRNMRDGIDRNSNSSLSKILHHCPRLRDFTIYNTLLYDFGEGFQLEQKTQVYGDIIFDNSMFGPLFLPSLSRHVCHISDMYIKGGYFVDRDQSSNILRGDNVTYIDIFMPDTRLGSITYIHEGTGVDLIYFTLLKTGKDQPDCYYGKKDSLDTYLLPLEPSSSKEPFSSKDNESILCISIKCVDIRKITIDIDNFQYDLDFNSNK